MSKSTKKIPCKICGQGCVGHKGLKIHNTKSHSEKVSGEKTYMPSICTLDTSFYGATSDRQDSTDNQIHERLYKVEEWSRSAIDAIARSCTSAGYHFSVKQYILPYIDKNKIDLSHKMSLIAKFFEMPNEKDHIEDLVWDIMIDLLVYGNAYLEKSFASNRLPRFNIDFENDTLNPLKFEKFPFKLYKLDAGQIAIKTNGKRITKYEQRCNGKLVASFNPRQVIHFKYPGPGVDVYGLSPLKTLQNAMAADLLAGQFNAQFFSNNATPRLHIDLGNVGVKELQRFVERANTQLKGKPHSSLVTTGGATVNAISVNNKDMEFDIYAKRLRERIFAVLGMQPAILGLVSDTRDLAHQISLFTNLTVKPLQKLVARRLNREVIMDFFKNTPIDYVFNPISSLDIESYVKQMDADLKNLVKTINEVRRDRGLPSVAWGNTPIIPYSDASQAILPTDGDEEDEGDDDDGRENE